MTAWLNGAVNGIDLLLMLAAVILVHLLFPNDQQNGD